MIEIEEFEYLSKKYTPYINSLIEKNKKFYKLNSPIKWQFGFNEKLAFFAWSDKNTNLITLNIASVDYSIQNNQNLLVELFLLHEMRHVYQYQEAELYISNPLICENIEMAKKWYYEFQEYVPASENNKNFNYYLQESEKDAFVYSYAIIMHKYGKVEYLNIPKVYEVLEIERELDHLINIFKNKNL